MNYVSKANLFNIPFSYFLLPFVFFLTSVYLLIALPSDFSIFEPETSLSHFPFSYEIVVIFSLTTSLVDSLSFCTAHQIEGANKLCSSSEEKQPQSFHTTAFQYFSHT